MAKGTGPGISNNPLGKPKGAKNKISSEVKARLVDFVENNFSEFQESFKSLKDEVKFKLFLEVLKFILPRPKDEDVENESDRRAKELLDRLWPINREK